MEKKFKVGDYIRLDNGRIGEITGTPSEGVFFVNGYMMCTDAHIIEKVDKKTAFLTELKELLTKYDAYIEAHIGEDDETFKPKPLMYIELGKGDVINYENYKDCDSVEITPSNIFDYDKGES